MNCVVLCTVCVDCVVLCIVCVDCVVLCIVCVQMRTVLLPPGVNPIEVKYISYHIILLTKYYWGDQIKEMSGACSMHKGEDSYI